MYYTSVSAFLLSLDPEEEGKKEQVWKNAEHSKPLVENFE